MKYAVIVVLVETYTIDYMALKRVSPDEEMSLNYAF